jgi:hypothetical protein
MELLESVRSGRLPACRTYNTASSAPEQILIQEVLIKYAFFFFFLVNVNSAEYLFKITNNYHEEIFAKFSVNVAFFVIRKYIRVFEVF